MIDSPMTDMITARIAKVSVQIVVNLVVEINPSAPKI